MSMYSGIIRDQADTIKALEALAKKYSELTHELIDVLSQHIDVSNYEKRLAQIKEIGKNE